MTQEEEHKLKRTKHMTVSRHEFYRHRNLRSVVPSRSENKGTPDRRLSASELTLRTLCRQTKTATHRNSAQLIFHKNERLIPKIKINFNLPLK